jgi:hypothetical protein
MIALVLQLICTLAVLLYIVAILVPGEPGKRLRVWAVGLFFGTFVFSIVMSVLWVEMHDWRAWVVLLLLSPLAYTVLRIRGTAPRADGKAKRRVSNRDRDRADGPEREW